MNQLLITISNSIQEFFDDICVTLPPEQQDKVMFLKSMVRDVLPKTQLAGFLVRFILPLKEKIVNRDETFFLQDECLFSALREQAEDVMIFKELWKNAPDNEAKECIWQWLDLFVLLSDKYNKIDSQ